MSFYNFELLLHFLHAICIDVILYLFHFMLSSHGPILHIWAASFQLNCLISPSHAICLLMEIATDTMLSLYTANSWLYINIHNFILTLCPTFAKIHFLWMFTKLIFSVLLSQNEYFYHFVTFTSVILFHEYWWTKFCANITDLFSLVSFLVYSPLSFLPTFLNFTKISL